MSYEDIMENIRALQYEVILDDFAEAMVEVFDEQSSINNNIVCTTFEEC